LLAVWGIPSAHEDDAERAVRCALSLVEAVSILGAEIGMPNLAARGGVMTGEAAVGVNSSGERGLAGDLINTASRLQSVAEPGSVFVGEATFRASDGAISYVEVGPLTLKGKDEAVDTWMALRVVAKRKGEGRPEGIEAPFVGRENELQLLKDSLHALSREHRAKLVSVTGIPGIGKSRLAWELLKYADGLAETIYWHHGRSPSYGEGISFWALAEMVRMRASISDEDESDVARQMLSRTLSEFVTDDEERSWIEPRLMHLIGLAGAPPGQREETFSAWRAFFERVAERSPVVMIFEDLQWADTGLIDFIESILEWSRNKEILVITLARPELLDRRPNWGAGQRNFVALHLDPLSEPAMRKLLAGLVPDLPERFAAPVLERAEGVPLYAVETVRMLIGKGFLVERDGTFALTGELSDLEVPETLHSLIASRLDTIPPSERALLQDASVLGKSFTAEGLSAIAGQSSEDLVGDLHDLVRRELLIVDNDPRSPERGQYGFLQGLIREVAYGTLARKERRSKHLSAAHYYESLADEELAGVVASHYLEAHRASPDGPERDALAARARDSLTEAGRRALSLGTPELALSYFEQALEVADPGTERAELCELAGLASGHVGAFDKAAAHFERALAEFQSSGDNDGAGRAMARLAQTLGRDVGRISEAIARVREMYDSTGESVDPWVRAKLAAHLADLYAQIGQPEEAHAWAERALVVAEQLDDPEVLAEAVSAKASALYNLGRHKEAVILMRGAAATAEAAGLLVQQAHALTALGVFSTDDEPRETLSAALRAVPIARRAGHRPIEVVNLLNAAEFAIVLGEWDDARSAIAEVDALSLETEVWRFFRDSDVGLLAGLSGDHAESRRLFDDVEAHDQAGEYVHRRATSLWHRALVSLANGDFEDAYRDAEGAVAVDPSGINSPSALQITARAALWLRDPERAAKAFEAMGAFRGRLMAAMRDTTEAGLAALNGRREDAAARYEGALRAWRTLEAPLDLALCQMDMVLLLAGHPSAEAAADEARDLLTRIGATPLLARLDDFAKKTPEPLSRSAPSA